MGDFEKKSYRPKGADYESIQRLVTRCDQLEKSKAQENNRLEASANKDTSRSIKRLQKASYTGLTPKIIQSGTSIDKSSLSKLGHKRLRKSLYMPALVAIRYNPTLKAVYERLVYNGKPKKWLLLL